MSKDALSLPRPRVRGRKRQEIRLQLVRAILEGRFAPGELLPSLRDLARQFQSSITPVSLAMQDLQNEGMVEMIHGSGCRVKRAHPHRISARRRPIVEILGPQEPEGNPVDLSRTDYGLQLGIFEVATSTAKIQTVITTLPRKNGTEELRAALHDVLHHKPDALIVGAVQVFTPEELQLIRSIHDAGIHVSFYCGHQSSDAFDRVFSDFEQGQFALTQHLLEMGHRELLRITYGAHLFFEELKQRGYQRALQAHGFPPETADLWTREIDHPEPRSLHSPTFRSFLGGLAVELGQRNITAIMAGNDANCIAVMKALAILNRSDVLVTGYDHCWSAVLKSNGPAFEFSGIGARHPISVDTNQVRCGRELAFMAIARVLGAAPHESQVVKVPQLLITSPET